MNDFPAIIDLTGYTEKMRKGFLEKTFFLEKIPATVYLDYGCADGSMIEFMFKLFPEYHYFGYDTDPHMIALAKKKNIPWATFSDNIYDLMEAIKKIDGKPKTAVVCSSLIHEVYSYEKARAPDFWRMLWWFDYVCIRDMMVTKEAETKPVSLENVWKIAKHYMYHDDLIFEDDTYILKTYQEKWGDITTAKNMVHFLLKYRYKNNWQRELNENYFWMNYEEFIKFVSGTYYNITYMNHYTLPFLKSKVKQDFDIDLDEKTHIQVILERK